MSRTRKRGVESKTISEYREFEEYFCYLQMREFFKIFKALNSFFNVVDGDNINNNSNSNSSDSNSIFSSSIWTVVSSGRESTTGIS